MRAAAVLVVALLVVVLTTAASGEKAGAIVRSNLAGQNVRLTLPTGRREAEGRRDLVPRPAGNVNDRIGTPWLDALRRDGWAIASSDFHLESWGTPESTDDTQRLVKWAEKQTGVPVTLWVSGSMGGATSLNAMVHGVAPPPCWYGVKPAVALTDMEEVPGGPENIAEAFDGPVPTDRNPIENVDLLPLETRYRVVSSVDDQWVIYARTATA